MDKSLLAELSKDDRHLLRGTERKELLKLDEDQVIELHSRIRRARNKNVGIYRRQAAGGVGKHGGRGKSRPKNTKATLRAEAFEEALANVSARLQELSAASATALRDERLAAPGRAPKPRPKSGQEARARERRNAAKRESKNAAVSAKKSRKAARKEARLWKDNHGRTAAE